MVLRSIPRALPAVAVLVLVGCNPLDREEIYSAYRCRIDDSTHTVAEVLDGDTIVLDDAETGEHVRLLGVDAPEIAHEEDGSSAECWGDESAAYMADLVYGQEVTLKFDAECTDKYDRTLAYVYLSSDISGNDDLLVNELTIREGNAEFYEEFGDIILHDVLTYAQSEAQAANLGLWAACH